MAAALTPTAPGSKLGPCKGKCQHRDCAAGRQLVARPCRFCSQALGHGARYYASSFSGDVAHADCLEDAIERNDARAGLF